MLGLPQSTQIRKAITKKKVFERFGAEMNPERRKRFDGDIARITLTNEISPVSVNLEAGEEIKSFFVVLIGLRQKEFDPQSIAFIARMFGQKLLMVLEADEQQRLALWQTKLIMGEWATPESLHINLIGLNLDEVWENIVARIAGIEMEQGNTLDEQLAIADRREKVQKEITKLEKLARAEKQPKRKFDLVQRIRQYREELRG
jgi:hypothetical protein